MNKTTNLRPWAALMAALTVNACTEMEGQELRDALVASGDLEMQDSLFPMEQSPPPVGSLTVDDDGDGFTESDGDCDDSRDDVYPGAPEYCDGDGVDNDCDGAQAPGDPNPTDGFWLTLDMDGDGVGDPGTRFQGCSTTFMSPVIVRLTRSWADCDDSTTLTRPYAPESADGVDNNCDAFLRGVPASQSWVDEHVGQAPCFVDNDGDGFGRSFLGWSSGACPAGTVNNKRDCDDSDNSRHPNAREVCDGVDDNCDGRADNAAGPGQDLFWWDMDGDGVGGGSSFQLWYGPCTVDYGNPLSRSYSPGSASMVPFGGDINDFDPTVW